MSDHDQQPTLDVGDGMTGQQRAARNAVPLSFDGRQVRQGGARWWWATVRPHVDPAEVGILGEPDPDQAAEVVPFVFAAGSSNRWPEVCEAHGRSTRWTSDLFVVTAELAVPPFPERRRMTRTVGGLVARGGASPAEGWAAVVATVGNATTSPLGYLERVALPARRDLDGDRRRLAADEQARRRAGGLA